MKNYRRKSQLHIIMRRLTLVSKALARSRNLYPSVPQPYVASSPYAG